MAFYIYNLGLRQISWRQKYEYVIHIIFSDKFTQCMLKKRSNLHEDYKT
ncbi:hypothetical protein HMPREF1982_00769 [Clostridiales bacterium oral taxon 876 str. F0540]|nr:hypothetical protein HMPREF1982_00769 [Clostridiales bacterium oral taxon 876 str. F0540]